MIAVPQVESRSWQGRLELEFVQDGDRTRLDRSFVQAPLKVQRPFYPEAGVCHTVMLHTAGGIVGSDRLALKIHLHPQAQALLTTAAATKVYRSNGSEAEQTTQIYVGEQACLEWLPQESIIFDGAVYRQNLRVDLAAGATWLGWEVTRLGRSARGEKFLSGTWRSRTEVWQQDRLLWVDPQWIQGGSEMLTSPQGLAGFPVVASFAFVGREVDKAVVEQLRSLWQQNQEATCLQQASSGAFESSPAEIGATRLMSGLLCRYRGNSTTEARRWLIQAWQLLRQTYLDRSACRPRVWQ